MSNTQLSVSSLVIIGCGTLFEEVNANLTMIGTGHDVIAVRLESLQATPQEIERVLLTYDSESTQVFVAMDAQSLGYPRRQLYERMRLLGFQGACLIHPSASVAADVRVGENCWIGAGTVIAHGVSIDDNTVLSNMVRIGAKTHLQAHSWVGAGVCVGVGVVLGEHCHIGQGVCLADGLKIGQHCVINKPGIYTDSLVDGSFIDLAFPLPVRIYTGTAA